MECPVSLIVDVDGDRKMKSLSQCFVILCFFLKWIDAEAGLNILSHGYGSQLQPVKQPIIATPIYAPFE